MKLFRLLWRQSPIQMSGVILLSFACAGLMMLLVRTVAGFIGDPAETTLPLLAYVALAVAVTGAQLLATGLMQFMGARTVRSLRGKLTAAISAASVVEIERKGSSALLNGLGEDSVRISMALPGVVGLARDLIFVIACLGYLLWLSPIASVALFTTLIVGGVLRLPVSRYAERALTAVRAAADAQMTLHRNLVDGAKQVKLSDSLRNALLGKLAEQRDSIASRVVRGNIALAAANTFSVLIFMALIGAMMYAMPASLAAPGVAATYTLILFFLLSPIQNIFGSLQSLAQAGVAAGRLKGLESDLDAAREGEYLPSANEGYRTIPRIELRDVRYSYAAEDGTEFSVGPVNLTLEPGDVVFVVGGNGSGKTTFVKLLCGLYAPTSGSILMDGTEVGSDNLPAYRSKIGAVFADAVVMTGLAGTDFDARLSARIDLLRRLKLDAAMSANKTLLARGGSFSTGEKKRLQLLMALEDARPVVVFDEFAADQDPAAKRFFYEVVLDELRNQGRISIVVTHDERFLGVAGKTLVFERGLPPVILGETAQRPRELSGDQSLGTDVQSTWKVSA